MHDQLVLKVPPTCTMRYIEIVYNHAVDVLTLYHHITFIIITTTYPSVESTGVHIVNTIMVTMNMIISCCMTLNY